MSDRIDVLGVGFDNITPEEAVEAALRLIGERSGGYVVTPNPEIVWLAKDSAELRQALGDARLVLPDGIGIIYAAKILGTSLKSRVPGIDFAMGLFERMAAEGKSVFLFGSKPGVAEEAARVLAERFAGLVIAGTHNGYFDDDTPIVEAINAARPDLLLVCLGAPKQELWMSANAGRLDVGLMAGLGGSLDVISGNVRRAPDIWIKLNLEWLYRLIKEPRRIKRMSVLPLFLLKVLAVRFRGKNDAR